MAAEGRDMKLRTGLAATLVLGAWVATPAWATGTTEPSAKIAAADLTPEERAERANRHACKVSLCQAFRAPASTEGNVTCDVLKTWRKEQLSKLVEKAKVSWPWGAARCTTRLSFKRADLARALSQPEYEARFDTHKVTCELDREADKYSVNVEIAPKVTFKDGKAIKAALNWGKIDAPLLAKSALWPATAADNTLGVLQSTIIEDINDFLGPKCDEVKEEWQRK
jgi:hypothetical protein